MKLLAIVVLAILVTPAIAEGNYTDDDLLEAMNMGISAGGFLATMTVSKGLYDMRAIQYSDLMGIIMKGNIEIREYNTYLEGHFNQTVINKMKLSEFSF